MAGARLGLTANVGRKPMMAGEHGGLTPACHPHLHDESQLRNFPIAQQQRRVELWGDA